MALLDEDRSKVDVRHVMRALKDTVRQGFWNGSLSPIGYRSVAAKRAEPASMGNRDRPSAPRYHAADLPIALEATAPPARFV